MNNNNNNNNTSSEIYIALQELFSSISCSKCKKNLFNPQQFLECGHISCISCISKIKTTSFPCECFIESVNDENNGSIESIIDICCRIAEVFGFRKSRRNKKKIIKCVSFKEESDNDSDTPENNFSLYSDNSNTISNNIFNHFECKPLIKSKKRKNSINLNYKNTKKAKFSKNLSKLIIPKNINRRNYHGETKLQEECKRGHIDNVKCLLKLGADPNIACNANWTPLQECADFGFYEIAELLLKYGANVNQQGYDGRTALHEAAKNNNFDMINLFLKYDAKVDIFDNSGEKAIDECKLKELEILWNYKSKDKIQNHNKIKQTNKDSKDTKNNTSGLKQIMYKNLFNKKEMKNKANFEHRSKNVTNDSDLENDLKKMAFEDCSNDNITSVNCLKETKDLINNNIYNASQDIDVVSIDSENTFDECCFEDMRNSSYEDTKNNLFSQNSVIIIDTDTEEFIDVIN